MVLTAELACNRSCGVAQTPSATPTGGSLLVSDTTLAGDGQVIGMGRGHLLRPC